MEYKRHIERNHQYLDFLDSDGEKVFMIVFDVSSLKEKELAVEFPEEKKLKVSLKHEFRKAGDITFSRDSVYVYMLPDNVQRSNLVAYWSEDDFLVIKEKKTKETGITSESRIKSDGCEFKSDETLSFSPGENKNGEKVKQETPSSSKNITPKKQSTSLSSENEEMMMNVLGLLNVSNNSGEGPMQDRVPTTTSGEIEETMQESKSMDHASTVQEMPRLFPQKVHNQFNRKLSEDFLQAAMIDIENRMNFVSEFIDKHSSN